MLHQTPPGICPRFVVAGLPQTINESNYWVSKIINECVADTDNVLNTVIMNELTDGV